MVNVDLLILILQYANAYLSNILRFWMKIFNVFVQSSFSFQRDVFRNTTLFSTYFYLSIQKQPNGWIACIFFFFFFLVLSSIKWKPIAFKIL